MLVDPLLPIGRVGPADVAASALRRAAGLDLAAKVSRSAAAAVVALSIVLSIGGWAWGDAATVVAVGGLLIGLPHGAVDHLAPTMRGHRLRARQLLVLLTSYVVLAAAAWAVLRSAPGFGLAALLVLSLLHFGAGEATFLRLRGARAGAGVALATGSAVIWLPLSLNADAVAPYLHLMVPSWSGRTAAPVAMATSVAALLLVAAVAAVAVHRHQAAVVIDLLLLTALAVFAPPVVAIATYFGAWHAVRYTAVMLGDEEASRGPGAVVRLARRAVLPTLAALTVLVVLWWVVAEHRLDHFLAEQVWVLAALTVPHAAVVWWLDRTRSDVARGS